MVNVKNKISVRKYYIYREREIGMLTKTYVLGSPINLWLDSKHRHHKVVEQVEVVRGYPEEEEEAEENIVDFSLYLFLPISSHLLEFYLQLSKYQNNIISRSYNKIT